MCGLSCEPWECLAPVAATGAILSGPWTHAFFGHEAFSEFGHRRGRAFEDCHFHAVVMIEMDVRCRPVEEVFVSGFGKIVSDPTRGPNDRFRDAATIG
jgi:hypothetical protein